MRNVKSKYILSALVFLLLPLLASVANACTCGQLSPCEAHAGASVIFAGRITQTGLKSVSKSFPANSISTTLLNGGVTSARFKVEEAFLGVSVAQIEISGEGTTCDFGFKTGERYLVFAYRNSKTGTFHTNICSGTAPLADSKDAVAYLRKAAKRRSGSSLSGEVFRELYSPEPGSEPMARTEIILENGKQRFRGLSNANGKFELLGIKPGHYRVHTNPATNYSRLEPSAEEPRKEWELDMPAQGCVQAWFVARPGGEISGSVVDNSGVVAEDIFPELLFADEKPSETSVRSKSLTEAKTFKFSFLPAGRYYLGFNLRGGPSILSPYPEFFYPGVEDRSKATLITLSEGQKVSNLYLPRPLRLAERVIEGVAVWPDGRPFTKDCGIQLINPRTNYREGNCVFPDNEGRFKIKAIEGQTYQLAGTIVGPNGGLISSKPIILKVEKENSPVKLVVESP